MKIYGAGSLEDIKKATELGVVGILTNPQGFEQYYQGKLTLNEISTAIVGATDLPVYIQIHGSSAMELVRRGREVHSLSPQIGLKIIADEKGFWAIKQLQKEGINCIATALFSISQAAVAASVGAFGICPFISRARESGLNPSEVLKVIKAGYQRLPKAPQIIAASLKGRGDIELAIAAGVDAVAMRYPLITEMMTHPLSQKAELLFAKNWANVKGENPGYLIPTLMTADAAE